MQHPDPEAVMKRRAKRKAEQHESKEAGRTKRAQCVSWEAKRQRGRFYSSRETLDQCRSTPNRNVTALRRLDMSS